MKRPCPLPLYRSSLGALAVVALTLSPHHHLGTAATYASSVRAATEEGLAADSSVVDETSSGGGSGPLDDPAPPPLLPPAFVSRKKESKKAPVAKLSRSSTTKSSGRSGEDDDASEIPLIGVGVGNLPHNKIPYLLASALSSPKKNEYSNDYRLIDTSHTESALEVLVGRSLSRLDDNENIYHVMIKIPHTHLGYERTMMSVQDSLSDILPAGLRAKEKKKKEKKKIMAGGTAATTSAPEVRVHAIIERPRCYDTLFSSPAYLSDPSRSVKHANCQEEETALDDATRLAGPSSPLLDKENAWKRSYRALEELYHHGTLESVGVSNFDSTDFEQLFEMATVGPHVYQGSLETLMTEEGVVEELVRKGVHYQCHDAAGVVVQGGEDYAPRAYAALERIGARHGGFSPVQVVLGWLVHHRGVGVVPGTTDLAHLAENSPRSLGEMARFGPREALDVETAVLAFAEGRDLEEENSSAEDNNRGTAQPKGTEEVIDSDGFSYHVSTSKNDAQRNPGDGEGDDAEGGWEGGVVATFFNALPRNDVRIFHVHPESGEQIQVSHSIPPGRSGRMIVNRDDVLIAYDGHGSAVKKFLVEETGNKKGSVDFSVEA